MFILVVIQIILLIKDFTTLITFITYSFTFTIILFTAIPNSLIYIFLMYRQTTLHRETELALITITLYTP